MRTDLLWAEEHQAATVDNKCNVIIPETFMQQVPGFAKSVFRDFRPDHRAYEYDTLRRFVRRRLE
jgi:hypothetical protein